MRSAIGVAERPGLLAGWRGRCTSPTRIARPSGPTTTTWTTGEATNERVFLDFSVVARPARRRLRRRGRLLLDRLLFGSAGPAGHAGRRRRPHGSRVPVVEADDAGVRRPTLSPRCSSPRSAAAGRTQRDPDQRRRGRALRDRDRGHAGWPETPLRAVVRRPGRPDGDRRSAARLVRAPRPARARRRSSAAGARSSARPTTRIRYAGIDRGPRGRRSGRARTTTRSWTRAPACASIARTGIGYDAVDVAAATAARDRGLQHARRPDDLDGRARGDAHAASSPSGVKRRRGRAPDGDGERLLRRHGGIELDGKVLGPGRLRPDRPARGDHRGRDRDAGRWSSTHTSPPPAIPAGSSPPTPSSAPRGRRRRLRPRPVDRRDSRDMFGAAASRR